MELLYLEQTVGKFISKGNIQNYGDLGSEKLKESW